MQINSLEVEVPNNVQDEDMNSGLEPFPLGVNIELHLDQEIVYLILDL